MTFEGRLERSTQYDSKFLPDDIFPAVGDIYSTNRVYFWYPSTDVAKLDELRVKASGERLTRKECLAFLLVARSSVCRSELRCFSRESRTMFPKTVVCFRINVSVYCALPARPSVNISNKSIVSRFRDKTDHPVAFRPGGFLPNPF